MARTFRDRKVVLWDIVTDKKEVFSSYAMLNVIHNKNNKRIKIGYKSDINKPLFKHRYYIKPLTDKSEWPDIETVRAHHPICLKHVSTKDSYLAFLDEKHLAKYLHVPKRIIDKLVSNGEQVFGNYYIKHYADVNPWVYELEDEYSFKQLEQMGEEQPRDFILIDESTNNKILFCDFNAAAQHIQCSVEEIKEGLLNDGRISIDNFTLEWYTGINKTIGNGNFYIHDKAIDRYSK